MGNVFASVELINCYDVEDARRHRIGGDEIRRMGLTLLVDTGAVMTCINDYIQEYLDLPVVGKKRYQLADGNWIVCDIVAGLELHFENRDAAGHAIVLPGDSEPLLGMLSLEEMDVLINPSRQQ